MVPPFCWECGREARSGQPLCPPCRRELRWLDPEPVVVAGVSLWAPVAYEGPARSLVRALKYRGAAGLAEPMTALVAAGAPAGLLAAPAELVPVPLHPRRRRLRGFNQAERLTAALARRTGLPVSDCLGRGGGAQRQVGRDRAQRLEGLAGQIALRAGGRAPLHVVLVDDVATTGATLAACAAALRRAGTQQVAAVVYARTPGR